MTDPTHKTDRDALVERIRQISHELAPIPTGVEPRTPRLGDTRAVLFDVYGTLVISASGDVGVRQVVRPQPEAQAEPGEEAPPQTDSDEQQGKSEDATDAPPEHPHAAALADALRSAGVRGVEERAAPRGVELLAQHIRAFHTVLRGRGAAYPEVDIRTIWGDVLRELGEEGLVADDLDPPRIERLAVEYECRVNPCWPMPGATDLLSRIVERGLPMGIVSNAQFFTPLLVKALFGASVTALGFREDLCAWSFTRLRAKPGEAMYRRVVNRLRAHDGIESEQVLYIGNDIRNDIRPAAALGCRTALFAGDQRSLRLREDDPECEGVEPDAVIRDLADVSKLL